MPPCMSGYLSIFVLFFLIIHVNNINNILSQDDLCWVSGDITSPNDLKYYIECPGLPELRIHEIFIHPYLIGVACWESLMWEGVLLDFMFWQSLGFGTYPVYQNQRSDLFYEQIPSGKTSILFTSGFLHFL